MPRMENSISSNENHMPTVESWGWLQSLMWKVGGQILKEMATRQTSTA